MKSTVLCWSLATRSPKTKAAQTLLRISQSLSVCRQLKNKGDAADILKDPAPFTVNHLLISLLVTLAPVVVWVAITAATNEAVNFPSSFLSITPAQYYYLVNSSGLPEHSIMCQTKPANTWQALETAEIQLPYIRNRWKKDRNSQKEKKERNSQTKKQCYCCHFLRRILRRYLFFTCIWVSSTRCGKHRAHWYNSCGVLQDKSA